MGNKNRSHKAQVVLDRLGKKLNRQIVGSMAACVHCAGVHAVMPHHSCVAVILCWIRRDASSGWMPG